jgi:CTP:molybdopterin cytidylyltransferase MocA
MLPGVILAAGDSTRMGSPKALLLTPNGRPFVVSIAATFASAGISDLVVVTGRDHERIVDAFSNSPLASTLRVVRNPDPSRGQLSSLHVAMDAVAHSDPAALLVTLVDVPMLSEQTVRLVIAEWERTRAPIVRPAIGDRHGHPVIFDRRVFDALRAAPLDAGAKTVVRAFERELLNVPVTDEGCLVDVDTPGDYESLGGGFHAG